MQAMILDAQGQALRLDELPRPSPGAEQILACGECRGDLNVIDGNLRQPKQSLVLGTSTHLVERLLARLSEDMSGEM